MRERKTMPVVVKMSRREKLGLLWLSDHYAESMNSVIRNLIRSECERLRWVPTANDALTDGLGFWPRPETKPAGPKELAELEAAARAETERK